MALPSPPLRANLMPPSEDVIPTKNSPTFLQNTLGRSLPPSPISKRISKTPRLSNPPSPSSEFSPSHISNSVSTLCAPIHPLIPSPPTIVYTRRNMVKRPPRPPLLSTSSESSFKGWSRKLSSRIALGWRIKHKTSKSSSSRSHSPLPSNSTLNIQGLMDHSSSPITTNQSPPSSQTSRSASESEAWKTIAVGKQLGIQFGSKEEDALQLLMDGDRGQKISK